MCLCVKTCENICLCENICVCVVDIIVHHCAISVSYVFSMFSIDILAIQPHTKYNVSSYPILVHNNTLCTHIDANGFRCHLAVWRHRFDLECFAVLVIVQHRARIAGRLVLICVTQSHEVHIV